MLPRLLRVALIFRYDAMLLYMNKIERTLKYIVSRVYLLHIEALVSDKSTFHLQLSWFMLQIVKGTRVIVRPRISTITVHSSSFPIYLYSIALKIICRLRS